MIEDFDAAIREAEEIQQGLRDGSVQPLNEYFVSYLADTLRRRQKLKEGEVEVLNLKLWNGMSPQEQKEYLARGTRLIQEGARFYSRLEVISRFRKGGAFQHSPLRTIEKQSLESMFFGRPTITWDMVTFVDLSVSREALGEHYNEKIKVRQQCRCADYYKKKKRRD